MLYTENHREQYNQFVSDCENLSTDQLKSAMHSRVIEHLERSQRKQYRDTYDYFMGLDRAETIKVLYNYSNDETLCSFVIFLTPFPKFKLQPVSLTK
jgi:ribonuclease HIII